MPKAFTNITRGSNRLEVSCKDDGPAELILIGAVGGSFWDDGGIKEKEVRDALKSIPKGKPINVHINSEGGSVQEGLGIYNAFSKRSADITAYVDGYALSIASVFPLAASKVVSPKSAIWMIHNAWVFAQGNAEDMRAAAEMLDEHDEALAEIYAEHTGKTIEEIKSAMAAETWIRGSAAVDFGLADETDETDASASAYRTLPAAYLSRCKNVVLNLFTPAANTPGSANTDTISAGAPGGARNTYRMDKIKALLKKHGVEVAENATEEQLMAALENIPTTKTDNTDKSGKTIVLDAGLSAQIAAMQKQLAEEKKMRVTAKIEKFIDDLVLTNDERAEALELALDENTGDKYLKSLEKRTPHTISGNSATGTTFTISAVDPVLDLKTKHPVRAERYAVQVRDWEQIMLEACRRDVRNGSIKDPMFAALTSAGILPFSNRNVSLPVATNTITSVLTNFLMDGSVTDLQNRWAMLKAFSVDTRPDGYKPLAPGILKHVTAGSTAQTDPTAYESGNNTVAPVTVTPHEHSVSYSISNLDLNSGVRMQDLVTINTANFGNIVIEAALAPVTAANFTGAVTTSAAAAFSFSDLATLQALLKKSPIKNLILDGAYIARISNTPGFFQTAGTVGGSPYAWRAYGWDGIYQNTDWAGAGTNVQGFACNPQAIAGLLGLPLLPPTIPGGIMASTVMTVDQLDFQVLAEAWFNPATRTLWNSLRCIDGWAKVDATAGFLLTSS